MSAARAAARALQLRRDLLARQRAARGARCVPRRSRRLTYGAARRARAALRGGIAALGLRREERLLLLAHDTVDWPVAFLGALYAGIVPVAVNTLLTADDYAYMLRNSRARRAIVSAPLLPALRAGARAGAHEIRASSCRGRGAQGGHARLRVAHRRRALPQTRGDARRRAAFWLYSSGSTGKPKGTVHTHANLYWTDALYGRQVLGLREDDVVFSPAKLFFAYGLGNALTFPLSAGATTVLMPERPTPAAVFDRLVSQRATVFFGVPTLYAGLLASPELPPRERVALRIAVSAGEALPREIGERFRAHFGCDILDGIGSTEMLHIFLSNRVGEVRYGTTGVPVPGYDIELRGEDGRPGAPTARSATCSCAAPSAALMYWGNRDKTRATFQGEWTKSGDKYVRDADGYYVYSGRGDDMLKVSGNTCRPSRSRRRSCAIPPCWRPP
jgi:benzoate-CoA ligase